MEVMNENTSEQAKGKRFRLIVRSAEEAVRVIREKLGENARVLSVRQVGGEGLKKFISSPKLEVIAELPSEDGAIASEADDDTHVLQDGLAPATSPNLKDVNEATVTETLKSEQEPEGITKGNVDLNSIEILLKAGFDSQLISVIETWSNWNDIKNLPLADTLKEITIGLSDRFKVTENQPVRDRIAIIGAPGVGKTTTLCKFLAHDVFMNKKTPNVLKVENGVPNGIGKLTDSYGGTHVGEWKNGEESGIGIRTWGVNGGKYIGEFSNGILMKGILYDKNGKITGRTY